MSMTVRTDETFEVAPILGAVAAADAGAARDRASRSLSGIARLFAERPELRGVHAPADLADDAIRWSA